MVAFGSLFAGIGGFDLGLESAGMTCEWQVEIDDSATKVLAARWPGVHRERDITSAGASVLSKVNAIVGGFPCQDLSVAGKRAGLMEGERSGLWWEMLRVICELQPELVVWENVAGLSSSDDGRDLARVIVSLRECGYFGCGRLVDAQYYGVAQRRRRWFGVFARGDSGAGRAAEILSIREGLRGHPAPSRKAWQGIAGTIEARTGGGGFPGTDGACAGHVVAAPVISPALKARDYKGPSSDGDGDGAPLIAHTLTGNGFDASEDGAGRGTPIVPIAFTQNQRDEVRTMEIAGALAAEPGMKQQTYVMQERMESLNPNAGPGGKGWSDDGVAFTLEARHRAQSVVHCGVRRLTPVECLRLQGFPDDWFDGTGLSDSQKYRLCGNAVAVPCAAWIGRRIVAAATDPSAK